MTEPVYKIVDVTTENVDEYDLFCHKSKKKMPGYRNKLAWFKQRYNEGLRIKLLLVHEGTRGFVSRGFIEYIPGEYAWRGIDAKGYMVIHCIWVVGRNKKKGYGSELMEMCVKDAEEMGLHGVAVVTSKKGHWLPKEKLFLKHSFEKVDTLPPFFELYTKRFSENAPLPRFYPVTEENIKKFGSGITLLYSYQCPYVYDMVAMVEEIARRADIPIQLEPLTDNSMVQEYGMHPYGVFCTLMDGEILTHHYETEKGFVKLLTERGIKF